MGRRAGGPHGIRSLVPSAVENHNYANAQLPSRPGGRVAGRGVSLRADGWKDASGVTSDDDSSHPIYVRYEDFLDADPRRRGDALELGIDWRDGENRHRACWYEATGELTLERLSDAERLDLDDFYRGVSGPVEILRRIHDRGELDRLLGAWPNSAPGQPRTVKRLRALVAGVPGGAVVTIGRSRRNR